MLIKCHIFLLACQEQGVGHLVYTSSYNVVMTGQPIEGGTEDLPYAQEHQVSVQI